MQRAITLPIGYTQPLFTIGQRTKSGKIIGVEYYSPGTMLADFCGQGWRYTVLTSIYDDEVHSILEKDIELLSTEEARAEILAEVDMHMMRLAILQEELNEYLDIRTPFGTIPPPIEQTVRSPRGTSRLSEPKKNLAA